MSERGEAGIPPSSEHGPSGPAPQAPRADERSDAPSYVVLDEIDWPDETRAPTAPVELVEQAQRLGARRKFLARGEGGFFSQYSEFPAGYTVPGHSHDHDEMIVVLAGSCRMSDGRVLGTFDSVVLHAGFEYGFTAGNDGMAFLTIRGGKSTTTLA
jgi:quercetin dioxygenase-like cupin family protein